MKFLAISLCLIAFVGAKKTFHGDQVLKLFPKTDEQAHVIRSLEETPGLVDFWNPKYGYGVKPHKTVDLRIPAENMDDLKTLFSDHGIDFEVKIANVQHLVDEELQSILKAKSFREMHDMNSYSTYNTYEEIVAWTTQVADHHPDTVKRTILGQSTEGRDIPMLTISTKEDNPSFLLDCGFHAREWISPAFCQCFLHTLLHSSSDPVIEKLLNELTVHIIPLVNPDGYVYSWTDDRMWRKTRSNYGTTCTGVDPNRNCDADWSGPGSSSNPCSQTYYGPAVESEPEVKAVSTFIRDNIGTLMGYVTVHSYSQLIIYPYSYTFELAETDQELDKYAEQSASAIEGVYGTVYEYGAGSRLLYRAAGGSDDFAYDQGVPIVYTYELRDTGEYGFLLPEDQIDATCVETTAGVLKVMEGATEIWNNRNSV